MVLARDFTNSKVKSIAVESSRCDSYLRLFVLWVRKRGGKQDRRIEGSGIFGMFSPHPFATTAWRGALGARRSRRLNNNLQEQIRGDLDRIMIRRKGEGPSTPW